jgi:Fe-S-cluster containining protein
MPIPKETRRQENFFDVCSHCKTNWSCCHETTPPITTKRKETIETYLEKNRIRIKNAFVKEEYVFPRLDSDGYCVFHDKKTRKCLVHSVKPETCVAGPITFDVNTNTGKIEWFIKMEKICPLAGRVYRNGPVLKKHVESAKREIFRLVKELDSQDLKAILKKDEPETFKIDADKADERVLEKVRKLSKDLTKSTNN